MNGRENQFGKRDPDNVLQNPVIVADLKISLSEFLVPVDAVEQVLDGCHGQFLRACAGWLCGDFSMVTGAATFLILS